MDCRTNNNFIGANKMHSVFHKGFYLLLLSISGLFVLSFALSSHHLSSSVLQGTTISAKCKKWSTSFQMVSGYFVSTSIRLLLKS